MSNMQQLGIIRRNPKNGLMMGRLMSLDLAVTVALRPVQSNHPDAPKFEVHGLNSKANAWVQIGAVWEKFSNTDGSAFLQGSIKDRSFGASPIYLLGFPRQNNETGEDEIVIGIPANRRRDRAPAEADDGLGESTGVDAGADAEAPKTKGKTKKDEEQEIPAL